MSEIVQNMR